MDLDDALIHFIRQFYVIEYMVSPTSYGEDKIILRDTFESKKITGNIIPITLHKNVNVTFLWNNSKTLTEMDLYRKDLNQLPGRIMKMLRHQKTMDFYDFLVKERVNVVIPLCDITEEFPLLFKTEILP
jgi:hypothetical protein